MLTAAELHAIVKDWPAGARPDGVSFESVSQQWQVDPHPRVTIHVPISDAHAVMLHEASAARWLIAQGHESKWDTARYTDPDTKALGLLCGAHLIETAWADGSGHFAFLLPYNDRGEYIQHAAKPDPETGEAVRPTRIHALSAAVLGVGS